MRMLNVKAVLIFLIVIFEKYKCIQGITCYNCTEEDCNQSVKCADGINTCYVAAGTKGDTPFFEADCAPYTDVCGENIKVFPPHEEAEEGAEGSGVGGTEEGGEGEGSPGTDEGENDDKGEDENEWRAEEEESMELGLTMCFVCDEDLCNMVQSLVPFAALYFIVVSFVVLDMKTILINSIYDI